MSPTNEEIEVLNRASEILSKYAAIGGLSRQDFDHFEKMVIAIIDEYGSNNHNEKQEKILMHPTKEETDTPSLNRLSSKLPGKGNIIKLGRYPESTTNQLRWIVLDISKSKCLLISESAVIKRAYHNTRDNITWEKSSLRAWLNGSFFNTAFNQKEKAAIVKTDIDNSIIQGYTHYDTYGGASTEDKVFLLSYMEAWKYFKYDKDRQIPREKWWLRSPGYSQDTAAYVGYHGERCSDYVNQNNVSIRPALWVETDLLESICDVPKVLPTNSETSVEMNPKTSDTIPLRDYLVNGSYSEKLYSGGELKVRKDGWSIEYYFPGPDRRYSGTFVSISGEQVEKYIQAWKTNFTKYEELKKGGLHGELQINGDLGMTIRIGGYAEGVCLQSYHMPKRSKEEIDRVIKDYQYAKNRANSLMGK